MAEIQKGVITQFANGMPIIRPFGEGDALTPPLVNRCVGYDAQGYIVFPAPLNVGNTVVFSMFCDGTGVVLAKI